MRRGTQRFGQMPDVNKYKVSPQIYVMVYISHIYPLTK